MKDLEEITLRIKDMEVELRTLGNTLKSWDQMRWIEDGGRVETRISELKGGISSLKWVLER